MHSSKKIVFNLTCHLKTYQEYMKATQVFWTRVSKSMNFLNIFVLLGMVVREEHLKNLQDFSIPNDIHAWFRKPFVHHFLWGQYHYSPLSLEAALFHKGTWKCWRSGRNSRMALPPLSYSSGLRPIPFSFLFLFSSSSFSSFFKILLK